MKTFNVTEGEGKLIVHLINSDTKYNISYDHGKLIFSKEDRQYIIPESNANTLYFDKPNPTTEKRKFAFNTIKELYRDILPNDFSPSNIIEVEKSSKHFSEEFTLSGINDKISINVPVGVYIYVNGDKVSNGYMADNGDVIKFEITAPETEKSTTTYVVNLGDLSKEFVISTRADAMFSCKAWRDAGYTTDGVYTLNAGGTEFQALCDMSRDDGGWTLVYKIANSSNMRSTGLVGNLTDLANATNSDSYVGKLSDTLIKSLYTEQYRVDQWQTGSMYAKFDNINSYADNVKSTKKTSGGYSSIANYNGTHDTAWNYGFSAWNYTVGNTILQLNYVDSRLGSHVQFNRTSGDAGCSGNGGCHSQVWIR